MEKIRAIRIHRFGGPEVLQLEEIPPPQPEDDGVVVRVHAASVNPVDYKMRRGGYPALPPERLPAVLGRDLSGVVARCGPRAQTLKPGDAIHAMIGRDRGAYAEEVAVRATEMTVKPDGLDHIHSAAVPLAGLTAWQGLFRHGGLRAGQRVLIHGGAGGVGHFAIQFAKARGAWVATTASARDLDFVRELGADQAVDYKAQRFEEVVEPVDLVYDLVGGETQSRSWAVVKQGGALVSTLTEPDQEEARRRSARGLRYMAEPNPAELAEIGRLIGQGMVRVVVSRVFPLEQAAEAHHVLEQEHPRGKVVLRVRD
ncbi:MAG TPA: NADP-dependent oxidoreductase [Crenalkalicoccus sp.]|nr:NADP-dependent oxidoreductase [Crenalkalicoccus sp.]